MRLIGLKTCDTCKKALRALPDAKFVDVRADGVAREELERFLAEFGEALVNRRSTTWRTLSEAQRQEDPIALLIAHPTLMKRPVIDVKCKLYLGWSKEVQAELLG